MDAVNAPRIHHQLIPMNIDYEADLPQTIVDELKNIGHAMKKSSTTSGFAALTAIGREDKALVPVYDKRRGGSRVVFSQ